MLGVTLSICAAQPAQPQHQHSHNQQNQQQQGKVVVHQFEVYKIGSKVTMECKGKDGKWGPGPICKETGEQMSFLFGVDSFQYCGWHIYNKTVFEHFAALMQTEENWNCRIPMVPEVPDGHNWYLPFTIPVWGIVERDHIHMDNHLNFIFHAHNGRILGVAAYPVRDQLQFGKEGSIITIHGPVRWFNGHSFQPLSSGSPGKGAAAPGEVRGHSAFFVAVCCALTLFLSGTIFSVLYKFYLRRRLIKKMLKTE
jgi:hypothetical protein